MEVRHETIYPPSLQDKLHSAKEKLRELYKLYPYLNPENDETTFMMEGLAHSYEEIIRLCA